MANERTRPSGIREVLDRVLQRLDRDQHLDAYRVWSFWAAEVGPAIAARAQPASYRGGILSVRVTNHAWMQELQFMKESIREKLNARLGRDLIRDIYFVTAPQAAPAPEPPAPAQPAAPTEEEEGDWPPAPAVRDPRLAEIYAQLLRARAARRRGGR